MLSRRRNLSVLLAGTLLLGSSSAFAKHVVFDVSFTSSTYATQVGDTFSDLLSEHLAGTSIGNTTVADGLAGVDTQLYANATRRDYSVLMTTTLNIGQEGNYRFQIGADWGRGGGAALIDESGVIVQEQVVTDDIWWSYNWNHGDVITSDYYLTEGIWTLAWVGFEGCCAGSSTVRFEFNNAGFQSLSFDTIGPYVVPVPASAWMMLSGLAGLTLLRRQQAA